MCGGGFTSKQQRAFVRTRSSTTRPLRSSGLTQFASRFMRPARNWTRGCLPPAEPPLASLGKSDASKAQKIK